MNELKIFSAVDLCIDGDGNQYQTVKIGEQFWMAENLKTTKLRNGTAIPTGHSNEDWQLSYSSAYAVAEGDAGNAATYGYLYNEYAVETGNLAPEGWRIPTSDEWGTLDDFIGNSGYTGIEGNTLKEVGYEHWEDSSDSDENGLDVYGFTALPGSYRSSSGSYGALGRYGYFWSSTETSSTVALRMRLAYNATDLQSGGGNKRFGYSVRCIQSAIGDDLTEVSLSSQAMSGVSITIPPSYASSDRWDTFGIPWNVSKAYWAIT